MTAATPRNPSPVVSVVLPTWNSADTIVRALDSVLSETEVPLECVVVDDGSSDGTAAIVADIARRDPRVRLIARPVNEGVSTVRNIALDEARGQWLAFLDADDRYRPGSLGRLHRIAIERDALAVVGQRVWTDGRREWISRFYDNPDIRQAGRKSMATHPGLVYFLALGGKLLKRSLAEGLRFEGRVLGDQPWTARALLRARDRIEVVDDVVYEWIRPAPDEAIETITTRKHTTIEAGVAPVVTARTAVLQIRAEADATIDDPALRRSFIAAYAERLLRADIGRLVVRWSAKGGPEVAQLYRAVDAFLEAIPADILATSDAFVGSIVLPPLRHWPGLAPPARYAAGRIIRRYRPVARGADRGTRGRRRRLLRLAILAARLPVRRLGARLAPRILAGARPSTTHGLPTA